MLKKSITYDDYVGTTVTEDFFFNLSKAELVELELSHKDGLSASLQKIVASEDGAEIIKEFKNIILKSYGEKSEDGRRFIKNQHLRDEFESTEAYSVLFMELVTDAEAAAAFIRGIMPQGLVDGSQLELVAPVERDPGPLEVVPPVPQVPQVSPKKLTQNEIAVMDADDLKSGLTSGRYVL
jgi:hypothetical protein